MNKIILPIDSEFLRNYLLEMEIDLEKISIRELNRLVDELSNKFNIQYLRFEFGIPGLKSSKIGRNEEIKIIKNNPNISSPYPPFDGVPRLKKATSNFIKNFLNIDVPPKYCIPTVGAMHSGFICQAIAGRKNRDQNKFIG